MKKEKTTQVKTKKKKKNKKKMETSKKIILASYIIAITFSVIVIVCTFMGLNVTDITTIAALVWGEVAVSNAHYYKKAAKENVPKILSSLPEYVKEQVDINQLLNQE